MCSCQTIYKLLKARLSKGSQAQEPLGKSPNRVLPAKHGLITNACNRTSKRTEMRTLIAIECNKHVNGKIWQAEELNLLILV